MGRVLDSDLPGTSHAALDVNQIIWATSGNARAWMRCVLCFYCHPCTESYTHTHTHVGVHIAKRHRYAHPLNHQCSLPIFPSGVSHQFFRALYKRKFIAAVLRGCLICKEPEGKERRGGGGKGAREPFQTHTGYQVLDSAVPHM